MRIRFRLRLRLASPIFNPGLLGRPGRPSVARAAWSIGVDWKDGDHAARASGGLLPSRDSRYSATYPWNARSPFVRDGPRCREIFPAQIRTRHVPVWRCFS